MRLPPQLGQKARPLQLKATSRSELQSAQHQRKASREHTTVERSAELLLHELGYTRRVMRLSRLGEECLELRLDDFVQQAVLGASTHIASHARARTPTAVARRMHTLGRRDREHTQTVLRAACQQFCNQPELDLSLLAAERAATMSTLPAAAASMDLGGASRPHAGAKSRS